MRRATISLGRGRGGDKRREFLTPLMAGSDPEKFAVLRQAAGDKRGINERIDRIVMNGQQVARPMSGVFDVIDGNSSWRDDFDNGLFRKTLKGE